MVRGGCDDESKRKKLFVCEGVLKLERIGVAIRLNQEEIERNCLLKILESVVSVCVCLG